MSTLRKKYSIWTDNSNTQIDCHIHPGALLARYMQWAGAEKGCASMYGPEPDVVNVGFISNKRIILPLDHTFYVKPDLKRDEWISFGWSENPKSIVRDVMKKEQCAWWINKAAKPPRKILEDRVWDYEK
jgi:hypothetical protein